MAMLVVSIVALIVSIIGVSISVFLFYLDSNAQTRMVLNRIDKLWSLVIEVPGDINATNEAKQSSLKNPFLLREPGNKISNWEGLSLKLVREYNDTVEFWINSLKAKAGNFKHLNTRTYIRWWVYINKVIKRLKALKKDLFVVNEYQQEGTDFVWPNFDETSKYNLRLDYRIWLDYKLDAEYKSDVVDMINSLENKSLKKGKKYLKEYNNFNFIVMAQCSQLGNETVIQSSKSKDLFLSDVVKLRFVNKGRYGTVASEQIMSINKFAEKQLLFRDRWRFPECIPVDCAEHGKDMLIVCDYHNRSGNMDIISWTIVNDRHFYYEQNLRKSIQLDADINKVEKGENITMDDVTIPDLLLDSVLSRKAPINKETMERVNNYLANPRYGTADFNELCGYRDYIKESLGLE